MVELTVDPEFQSLIPALTDDEYQRLEKSILAEGVREPLITWDGTIIDGHNRYRICQEHGIEFKTTEREFTSRDAAKIWIIENQFGRRNLSSYDRAELVLKLEPLYESEARRRSHANLKRGGHAPEPPKLAARTDTRDKLSKIAGVSHGTLSKVKAIEKAAKKGDAVAIAERAALKSGEKKSIHGAYVRVTGRGRQRDKDGRRICTICGKPIDEGTHYQDKLNWHYQCGMARKNENQRNYRDADRDLRANVPTYTTESLKAELLASARTMQTAVKESIAINESMGVRLTDKQKKDLLDEIGHVIRVINRI